MVLQGGLGIGDRAWRWLQRAIVLSLCAIGWSLLVWSLLIQGSWAAELTEPAIERSLTVEQGVPSRSGLDASDISSEKISQFVQAYLKVVALIEQRESDLQGAETESESLQMQQEIQAEALGLIQAEGLTVQEYLQLLGFANIDPEFGERVAAHLQEEAD